jgi:hypothetical protein
MLLKFTPLRATSESIPKMNNQPQQTSHAERGRAGAIARWGDRGPSVTIRVDEAAAQALATLPQADRRAFASAAILRALGRG